MTWILIALLALAAVGGALVYKGFRDSRESDAEHIVERLTARLARGTIIPLSKVRMRGRHRKGSVS